MNVETFLALSRAGIERVGVGEVGAAQRAGAVLVDIRSDDQLRRDGLIPGAVRIARNVLEWRCEPSSPWRDRRVSDPRRQLILLCDEGYQSSPAAATLRQLGHPSATDVVGGFRAWRRAGLPVTPPVVPPDDRR